MSGGWLIVDIARTSRGFGSFRCCRMRSVKGLRMRVTFVVVAGVLGVAGIEIERGWRTVHLNWGVSDWTVGWWTGSEWFTVAVPRPGHRFAGCQRRLRYVTVVAFVGWRTMRMVRVGMIVMTSCMPVGLYWYRIRERRANVSIVGTNGARTDR